MYLSRPLSHSLLPVLAVLSLCASPVFAQESAPGGDQGVVISGFLEGSILAGQGEQCVLLANLTDQPLDLGGYQISNRYGPGAPRQVVFPPDTLIAPFGELVVARDGAAYRQQFGEPPDLELGRDVRNPANDAGIPDMSGRGWPLEVDNYHGGVLALLAPDGETVVDAVAWDFEKETYLNTVLGPLRRYERKHDLPEGSVWSGAPLDPYGNLGSPFGARSRVFIRDHDAHWRYLPDTHGAADWDGAASSVHLGSDATHRVLMAGQSRFDPQPHRERAVATLASAPDNNHQALLDAWAAAEREILVSVYYFANLYLLDGLLEAIERGVDVTLWLEGGTVGVADGFSDLERYICQQIEQAGRERSGDPSHGLGRVYWLGSDKERHVADRYAFDHSKYSIIDGRVVVIGSENYGMTGHAVDPGFGNRGWEVHVATPPGQEPLEVVRDLLAVWRDDVDPDHHHDVIRYDDDPTTFDARSGRGRYGPPPPGFDPTPFRQVKSGRYWSPFPEEAPVLEGEFDMQLVLSPDNSLHEQDAILGAIAGAQEEILVNHLDLRASWGSGKVKGVERGPDTTPDLLLEALVGAARRGVRLRVLLDCSGLGCESGSYNKNPANNDDTIRYLRTLAQAEGLDVQARYFDVFSTEDLEEDWQHVDDEEDLGLSKVHNKGLVIDRRTVLFSSINGSENSFKGNREVGLLLSHPQVAAHYAYLFDYDWTTIAAPRGVEVVSGAGTQGAASGDRCHWELTGLQADGRYSLRVSAFDNDDSDVDRLDYHTPVGPHESALSVEVSAQADEDGELSASWQANHSEDLEGDLAGYRVYWSPVSMAQARTAGDMRRWGLLGEGGVQMVEVGVCRVDPG